MPRRPQYRKPFRRRPGEAPPSHRVYLASAQAVKETPGPDGRTFFRVHLENEPSPEWMRAWRAGLLGLMPEDRDAVMRLEFQGASVRFPAQDGEVGRIRGVLERRIESVNQILSGGRSAPTA